MTHRFLEIAGTPAVKAAQAANGSRRSYARLETGPTTHDTLGPAEAEFIARRDSFYMASVSETGWPYVQHRGGVPGFLKPLDEHTIGFLDYRGNRQYISLGNLAENDRVALILMDYPARRRLKLFGRLRAVSLVDEAETASRLIGEGSVAVAERGFLIRVEAFDWNCPQHITPRFTEAEIAAAIEPLRDRLDRAEQENAALRAKLTAMKKEPTK